MTKSMDIAELQGPETHIRGKEVLTEIQGCCYKIFGFCIGAEQQGKLKLERSISFINSSSMEILLTHLSRETYPTFT